MIRINWSSQTNRLRSCLTVLIVAVFAIRLTETNSVVQTANQDYLVYVVCESADKIALIRFGQRGASVDKLIDTGSMPSDIDGPHGIVV